MSTVTGTNPVAIVASSTVSTAANSVYADLSAATAATINAIRMAFQVQRLLERDARGGIVTIGRAHV